MRDLKYKAWHKTEKRWIDLNGFSIAFKSCLNVGSVYAVTEQGVIKEYYSNEVEIVEFTGLKDKNGKEWYFDDLVSNNLNSDKEVIRQVVLHEGCIMLKRIKGKSNLPKLLNAYEWHKLNFLVVGNIHKNPELL